MEQFVAIHDNKFIGSMAQNLERIVLSFYVENITDDLTKKWNNDIYIIIQGNKLHEYQQLDEIQGINPLNIYGYNSIQKYQQQYLNVRLIMERNKNNDTEHRIKKCAWIIQDPYKTSGQDLQDLMQKLFDDVCFM